MFDGTEQFLNFPTHFYSNIWRKALPPRLAPGKRQLQYYYMICGACFQLYFGPRRLMHFFDGMIDRCQLLAASAGILLSIIFHFAYTRRLLPFRHTLAYSLAFDGHYLFSQRILMISFSH